MKQQHSHTHTHTHTHSSLTCIVRNVGRSVEQLIDAMAAVGAHDREALGVRVLGDDVAQVAILSAGLDCACGDHCQLN